MLRHCSVLCGRTLCGRPLSYPYVSCGRLEVIAPLQQPCWCDWGHGSVCWILARSRARKACYASAVSRGLVLYGDCLDCVGRVSSALTTTSQIIVVPPAADLISFKHADAQIKEMLNQNADLQCVGFKSKFLSTYFSRRWFGDFSTLVLNSDNYMC